MARDFRFGVGLLPKTSRSAWQEAARRMESFGYDILQVPDHLGAPAPFPALVSAAEVTTMRLGTFVLNAGFYKPALLARDAGAVDELSDGRFELGLGTGYVKEEFEQAELPYPTAGQRVDYLEHVTAYMQAHLSHVPIMIAGAGNRVLTIAAQRAQIVAIAGGRDVDEVGERIEFVRQVAGDRFDELELNLAIIGVPRNGSGKPSLSLARRSFPDAPEEELLKLPGVLSGTPRDIADTLRQHRDAYGLTYFSVQEHLAESFTKVIEELR
jgi:probable F420-dependent oxidoreductase